MNPIARILGSSLGKKYLMALSGLALYGFVIIHMVGNLQIFIGADALNAYAKFLKAVPEILWGFRLGLLAMAAIHIWTAYSLTLENRAARKISYANYKPVGSTLASRTMAVSGTVVLAFIVFHILHFTVHKVDPGYDHLYDELGRHDVYRMVINGFSVVPISLFYIVSVGLLCFHLSHGIQSLFHSLGLVNRTYDVYWKLLARVTSAAIFVGMSSIPVAVLLKIIK